MSKRTNIYSYTLLLIAAVEGGIEDRLESMNNLLLSMQTKMEKHGIALQQIVTQNETVKDDLKSIKRNLKKSQTEPLIKEPSNLPELPIKNIEELEAMEKLLENFDMKNELANELSTIGGSKRSSVIYNIMNSLLSKEVANMFSLLGKKQKRPFKDLKLYDCVTSELKSKLN